MSSETGGPAFPVAWPLPNTPEPGMTLRDYFMAHAPAKPWPFYQPVMPPKPDRGLIRGRSGNMYTTVMAAECAEGDNWEFVNQKAVDEWNAEKERQHWIQWPRFYADAMLEARK